MSDDFCHGKAFVAKITAKTQKSVVKIKETVTSKDRDFSLTDEVRLWFDLPKGRSLYTKIKSTDYLKVHYDHGLKEYNPGKFVNYYCSVNANKHLQNIALKFGVGFLSDKFDCENRVKFTAQQNSNVWHLYHRSMVTHNNFLFGFLGVFDITNKHLQKNNLFVRYAYNEKTDVFPRCEVDGFRKFSLDLQRGDALFDNLITNVVRKVDDKSKIGLEVVVH